MPPQDRGAALDAGQRALVDAVRHRLGEQIVRTAFAPGDRDIESLGLAHARPDDSFPRQGACRRDCTGLRLLGSSTAATQAAHHLDRRVEERLA